MTVAVTQAERERIVRAARAPIAAWANNGRIRGGERDLWASDIDALAGEVLDAALPALQRPAAPDVETLHQTIFKALYDRLEMRISEHTMSGAIWLSAEDAAKDVAALLADQRPEVK